MSQISIGLSHPKPCPGRTTLRRCSNNEDTKNVIDLDSENSDNVTIIDVPESLSKKFRGPSNLWKDKWSFSNVIHIEDDETPMNQASDNGDYPECDVTVVEMQASDNGDYPECDVMVDSSGKVQEQWEKGFSRKKKGVKNGDSGVGNNDSTSKGINGNQEEAPSSCTHLHDNKYDEFPKPDSLFIHVEDFFNVKACSVKDEGGKDDRCQNGDALPFVDSFIINGREKLKETDEYKRAAEEEWASRRRTLQIQAEEAQCLRQMQKKREEESMRLLDMERRQALQIQAEEAQRQRQMQKRKEAESKRLKDTEKRQNKRLKEIRDSQRKDKKNMDLKEVIRAEVRNELKKLEASCHNMASLLHSLGIHMGGWPNPLPQEVQTAYKKALLTFHPDRAARSDIRQQVEAEEKFKLVNRLKDKFPPFS